MNPVEELANVELPFALVSFKLGQIVYDLITNVEEGVDAHNRQMYYVTSSVSIGFSHSAPGQARIKTFELNNTYMFHPDLAMDQLYIRKSKILHPTEGKRELIQELL